MNTDTDELLQSIIDHQAGIEKDLERLVDQDPAIVEIAEKIKSDHAELIDLIRNSENPLQTAHTLYPDAIL
jgi:hypothetical protein